MSARTVLDGIRVLDYGRFIAAPWCSAILADMGADVIRVEKREGGEDRWVQAVTEAVRAAPSSSATATSGRSPSTPPPRRAPRSPAGWWPAPTWSSPTCRRRRCGPAGSTTRASGR